MIEITIRGSIKTALEATASRGIIMSSVRSRGGLYTDGVVAESARPTLLTWIREADVPLRPGDLLSIADL